MRGSAGAGGSPKHTRLTRTAAPLLIQGSSLQAAKMGMAATMRSSTLRLAPPRMELVATRPARFALPAAIWARAFSNQ